MHLPNLFLPMLALHLMFPWGVAAQAPLPAEAPAQAPAVSAENTPTLPGCLVSGFRSVALQNHDIVRREQLALAWLRDNGERCTAEQMVTIGSNLGIWLGRAESVRISTAVEGLLHLAVNPDDFNREQVRQALGIPPPPPPPKPAPPVVPVVAAPPPEMARPQTQARITPLERRRITAYFSRWPGTQACPGNLVPVDMNCESDPEAKRHWAYGQPLPSTAQSQLAPAALLARVGPARSGLEWAMLDDDVLLVDIRSRVVIDAVLDLGRPKVKAPPPPPADEEAQQRPLQTPPRVLR